MEGLSEIHLSRWQVGVTGSRLRKVLSFTDERLRKAISNFDPYKVSESDGVYPTLLQKDLRMLVLPFCKTLRAVGHLPSYWQEARILFISKAG